MYLKSLLVLLTASTLAACSPKTENQAASSGLSGGDHLTLFNVSYDVSRDFYKDYNPIFVKAYQDKHAGTTINVQQSHGGSSKQALAVANGLQADVVTMNQSSDINLLVKKGLVSADWQQKFPNSSVPFTSITVFLVRKGNPQHIKDWADLARDNLKVVIANPKTTGNGRYTFLAAYGYALKANANNDAKAREYMDKLLQNVPVFENGGRAATTTFVQRNIGDVLVTFENEANLAAKQFGAGEFEIVYPQYSVLMESPVAVVSSVTNKKGTTEAATEYLNDLWSKPAQELGAKLYLRPANAEVLAANEKVFPPVETFRPTDVFGPWDEIMKKYFADGGVFDQLTTHSK
ncbi:MAG: sulfate ABC transporter substrate-binding protein [Neisseria sp.]|uniref:sulfate ABC transporter substrate-binding protein n=1 Tax=Neisseria sp. TaxID=192066 RepID=UPI0026DAFAFA|nr:sulfate ABC transporter substrate-binding protein [Neisseria sp.]MDO4640834.1 sulfate ABC transporter substrate-binding protein [Neisseria sp.]